MPCVQGTGTSGSPSMNMRRFVDGRGLAVAAVIGGVASLGGCEGEKPADAVGNALNKTTEVAKEAGSAAAKEAGAALESAKATLLSSVDQTYQAAKTQFESLRGKVSALPATPKPVADKLVTDLDGLLKSAEAKLAELKGAAAD